MPKYDLKTLKQHLKTLQSIMILKQCVVGHERYEAKMHRNDSQAGKSFFTPIPLFPQNHHRPIITQSILRCSVTDSMTRVWDIATLNDSLNVGPLNPHRCVSNLQFITGSTVSLKICYDHIMPSKLQSWGCTGTFLKACSMSVFASNVPHPSRTICRTAS